MTISGIMPLRNAVQLGYPFELAIRSLRPLCDEVVILVDPWSEDDTLDRVRALSPDVIVESVWDQANHDGRSNEIARQTVIAYDRAGGDWILSLQADELLHEGEANIVRRGVEEAVRDGFTAIELTRWYFFGSLDRYRSNWTVPLPRLVQKSRWWPDPASGAMYFVPATEGDRKMPIPAGIYHYSRVGDPLAIARRVRNLDTFYHPTDRVASVEDVPEYVFDLRKLDTYVLGHEAEADKEAKLLPFPLDRHPEAARRYFLDG